jgi:hypothetical protein
MTAEISIAQIEVEDMKFKFLFEKQSDKTGIIYGTRDKQKVGRISFDAFGSSLERFFIHLISVGIYWLLNHLI